MRICILILFILIGGCSSPAIKDKTSPAQKKTENTITVQKQISLVLPLIQPGDLVFRTGNDLTSFFFKQLNLTDKTYSHCGIASVEHDTVYVYHALGGEFNPDQKILKQTFAQFTSPAENAGFGIYRLSLSKTDKTKIVSKADSLYQLGISFDLAFDLATNNKMYCAEYIYKCIIWGTDGRCNIPQTSINSKTGVATDNLFINKYSSRVTRISYR